MLFSGADPELGGKGVEIVHHLPPAIFNLGINQFNKPFQQINGCLF